MTDIDSNINHISDTALWVAVYRAMETRRKDALFRDPYAEILAGERGKQIVKNMKEGKNSAWSMIVRTFVMDEFIKKTVSGDNIDAVVNLAAGLDTRPYRLNLPSSLQWIEADLPDILDYKEDKLADAKPRCGLERIRLDLTDQSNRKSIFKKINGSYKRVLVISEGLLVYLKNEDVMGLARDLNSQPNFYWWIIDILTPELLSWLLKNALKRFASGKVTMHFAPENGADFFLPLGWNAAEVRRISEESRRLRRERPGAWLFRLLAPLAPKRQKEFYSKLDTNFVLLNRTEAKDSNT